MSLKTFLGGSSEYVKVDDKNRFYFMLQQMQSNRWRITAIVLGLFFMIILGINNVPSREIISTTVNPFLESPSYLTLTDSDPLIPIVD